MLYNTIDPAFSQLPPQYQIAFFVVYGIVALIGLIQLIIGLVLIVKEVNLRNSNKNEAMLLINNLNKTSEENQTVEIVKTPDNDNKKTE